MHIPKPSDFLNAIRVTNEPTDSLFVLVCFYLVNLGDDVTWEETETRGYIPFKYKDASSQRQNFAAARIAAQKNAVILEVKLDQKTIDTSPSFVVPAGEKHDRPDHHFELVIDGLDTFEKALPYIRHSYNLR